MPFLAKEEGQREGVRTLTLASAVSHKLSQEHGASQTLVLSDVFVAVWAKQAPL